MLSAETALEFLDEKLRKRVQIADAPILEGAISAAVEASLGSSLASVRATAEGAGISAQVIGREEENSYGSNCSDY